MSSLGESLVELISTMQAKRQSEGKAPSSVLYLELMEEISKELDLLQQEGRITIGRTINNKYISVNGNQ